MRRGYRSKDQHWTSGSIHFAVVVNNWNSLTVNPVNASSLIDFERQLGWVWKHQKQKFYYAVKIENKYLDPNDHSTTEYSVSDSELESQA